MRAYAAGSCGSPHSSHSVIVSGSVGIEHRGDDVDERHLGDDRREQVGPEVRDRAHEQTARAPAAGDEPRRRRVARVAIRVSAHAMKSVNVLALCSRRPSSYQPRPSSPPPRTCAIANTKPRSSSDSA